jgi:hypothetical protein
MKGDNDFRGICDFDGRMTKATKKASFFLIFSELLNQIIDRLIDLDGTMDLGAGHGIIAGVSSRLDEIADPYSLDVVADVDIDFDTAGEAVLIDLVAATVGHTLVAALAHEHDHFWVDTVGLESYVDLKDAVFRAGDWSASVRFHLVVHTQSDSVRDSFGYFVSRDISEEAVCQTDWDWTCCIGVRSYHRSFRTRCQTLTLPVPTNLQPRA